MDLGGLRIGVPVELSGEGIEPGVLASFRAALELARSLGASVEPCELPHAPHALAAYYVLAPAECSSNLARFDGVRYGLRAARLRCETSFRCTRARATTGSAPEVQAGASCSAHTRALRAATTTRTTSRAQRVRYEDRTGLQRCVRAFRPARHANLADGCLRARRPHRGPARDVPQRRLHGADVAGRDPGDLAAVCGLAQPPGGGPELPVRAPAGRPGVQSKNRLLEAAFAFEQAIGFDGAAVRA